MATQTDVLAAIRAGHQTSKAISAAIGASNDAVAAMLCKLVATGKAVRVGWLRPERGRALVRFDVAR